MIARFFSLVVATVLTAACGSVAPIPQETFYRLGDLPKEGFSSVIPWTDRSVVIKRIRANGIYKDRALAMLKSDGVSLQQSSYHYWNDSPEILVQQRLYAHAVHNGIAPHVALEMVDDAAYVISGRLLRFEKLETSDAGGRVAIELALKLSPVDVDNNNEGFERTLKFSQATSSADINEAVKAIASGLDSLIAQFFTEATIALSAQDSDVDN